MHFTFISIAVLVSCSTIHSHPAVESSEPSLKRSRPVQQFFKNILNALRVRETTTQEPPRSTTKRVAKPSPWLTNIQQQEIPNFTDFSTYLLQSLASNNSAVKFTYMQPNASVPMPMLRGNFSVISFVVPDNVDKNENKTKGVFSFITSRLPWSRPTSDTDFSQFPPVLEYFTQRIQAYFSIYKYTDESRLNNTFVVFLPDDDAVGGNAILSEEELETTTDNQVETTTDTELQGDLGEDNTTTEISNEM